MGNGKWQTLMGSDFEWLDYCYGEMGNGGNGGRLLLIDCGINGIRP